MPFGGKYLENMYDHVIWYAKDKKKAKFNTVKNGKKYYFCSKNCYDKFNEKSALTKKTINKK